MTPERLKELRESNQPSSTIWECIEYIEDLQNKLFAHRTRENEREADIERSESALASMIEERDKLRTELAALRTPHACWDCQRYYEDGCACVEVPLFFATVSDKLWLCGHFTPKRA